MASEKLTNSDRDFIINRITQPIQELINQELIKLGETIDDFLMDQLPAEVIRLDEKYPNLVRKVKTLYYHKIVNPNGGWGNSSVPIKYGFIGMFDEDIERAVRKAEIGKDHIRTIDRLNKEMATIEGKTRCVLYNSINTTKQLREQFPEAYAILMKVTEDEVKNNLCDSVENLRAELSKYNKDGKK